MRARLACALAAWGVLAAGVWPSAQEKPVSRMYADELFVAYQKRGESVLADAFPTIVRFEDFRGDFRDRVLTAWEADERTRDKAMFMLDTALAALSRGYRYWLDFVNLGRGFLAGRADPPGVDPDFDQFELLWSKTTMAALSGQRNPGNLQEQLRGGMGVASPVARRVRPTPAQESDRPALVDPWILQVLGFSEELFTIAEPRLLETNGPSAIAYYDQALEHPSVRAESALRAAWLLIRLGRAGEALDRLDGFDDRWTNDAVLVYWRRLFRGKALEALNRPDEAARAYEQALQVVPTAQSPRMAMMAIDVRLNRAGSASARAAEIRTAADPVIDPWWTYQFGDLRFYPARLKALRSMVTR